MQTKSACGYSVHNLLLGPPGAGTSRLGRRLATILPKMTLAEAIDTTRPCRAPPQTMAAGGLIGGGQVPVPAEVSRAHHSALCLDELPAFRRHVLEVLRQPLDKSLMEV
jgi:magnesium chelatase family protein